MPTDVRLDEIDGYVTLEGRVIKAVASDFILESPERRKAAGGQHRRALVHDQADGLTINYNGDYPGGITLNNVAQISPLQQKGGVQEGGDLIVRGGISYEAQGVNKAGKITKITVSLNQELSELHAEIEKLKAKVAALEKK